VKHLSAVYQRVLGLQRVGEAVEFLEPGIGVVLAVLGCSTARGEPVAEPEPDV
jgi:hypothetical protein